MALITPTITLEAYLGGSWVDIFPYQVGRISVAWGISGNGPIDFMADTGTLQFTLWNSTGIFSPNGASPISPDWKKGAKVKLVISSGALSRAWVGYIDDFSFETDSVHNGSRVTVYAVDWMDKTAKYPINYPDIILEKTSDQIMGTIIAAMPIAPLDSAYAVGVNTFPVVFDTVTDFTYARTEINKVLLSELAYCYVQHSGTIGEKLILENANSRVSPTAKVISGSAFRIGNNAPSVETSFGDNVVNDISFRYIPKRYSNASGPANFVWTSPIQPQPTVTEPGGYNILLSIGPGETKTINLKYGIFNNGLGPVPDNHFFEYVGENSILKISKPFPTGFYIANMYDSGSYEFAGTDITANLQVDAFECFQDKIKVTLTNTHATSRGYIEAGILRTPASASTLIIIDPDVQVYIQDAPSILAHDHQPLQFDQVYQITTTKGTAFANQVLADEVNPRTVLNRINLNANKSAFWMNAFLSLDIGDYFPVENTNRGIDGNFFVQDMRFTIDPGGIIFYSLGVKEQLPRYEQVTIGTNYSETGNNVSTKTISSTVVSATANAAIFVTIAKRGYNDVTSVIRTTSGSPQNFTLYRADEFANNNYPRYEIWQLIAPVAGTFDIIVTLPGNDWFSIGAVVLYGVNQTTPVRGYAQTQGTTQTMALSISSKPTDVILDLLSIEKRVFPETIPTLTAAAGQTEKMNATPDGNWSGAASTKPGASTVTMGWSNSSALAHNWIYVAISIQGVAL